MFALLAGLLLLGIAFLVCDWSGRTLAHHYQDRLEVAAIAAIGGCVVLGLVLTEGAREGGNDWPAVALALAASSGLFAGYLRGGAR